MAGTLTSVLTDPQVSGGAVRRPQACVALCPLTAQCRGAQRAWRHAPCLALHCAHASLCGCPAQQTPTLYRPASHSAQVQETVSQVAVAAGLNSDVVVQAVGRTGAAITQLQQAGGRATALLGECTSGAHLRLAAFCGCTFVA